MGCLKRSTWRKRANCTPDVCSWPKVSIKNYINIAILNVSLAPESGHSEYTFGGRSECLLMAESSRSLTSVNGNFGLNTGRSGDIFRG